MQCLHFPDYFIASLLPAPLLFKYLQDSNTLQLVNMSLKFLLVYIPRPLPHPYNFLTEEARLFALKFLSQGNLYRQAPKSDCIPVVPLFIIFSVK